MPPNHHAFVRRLLLLVVACAAATSAQGANQNGERRLTPAVERTARIGDQSGVRFLRNDKTLLLHAADTAAAFGWEAKVVTKGRLLTICRDADDANGACIPVRLDKTAHRDLDAGLFVDAEVLAGALRFTVERQDGKVSLKKTEPTDAVDSDVPAYNAAWGAGRGFRPGQTLPDIPLVDTDGEEVRFSRFLGKRYILYVWASW